MYKAISADIGVFEYLCERSGDRKSKTEAFLDLLYKASDGFISPFLRKKEAKLGPCQCHVNISDLASEWNWHRATVRAFLDKLEEMGQLKRTKYAKSVVITMPAYDSEIYDSETKGKIEFTQLLMDELFDWIIGRNTTAATGISCGRIIKSEMGRIDDDDSNDCSDTNLGTAIGKSQTEIVEKALGCMALAALQKVIRKSRFDDTAPLRQFFTQELGNDWCAFLDASKELSELIIGNDKAEIQSGMPDEGKMLKSLRNPFLSLIAKSQDSF